MFELFQARIHWGKWFPQNSEQLNQLYPKIDTFEMSAIDTIKWCFRNRFVEEKLGF